MKKILILLIAISASTPLFAAKSDDIKINAKINLPSQIEVSYEGESSKVKTDNGVSIGIEYSTDKSYGFGIEYMIERSHVSVIPVYFFVGAKSGKAGIQGNVGYNMISISNASDQKVNGGLYLAGSVFVALNDDMKIIAEYSVNNGSIDYDGDSVAIAYPKVSFGLSLNLN